MAKIKLIADSGSTKAEWTVIGLPKKKTINTQGISPYFLSTEQIQDLLTKELIPKLKGIAIDEVYYYGTGCANPANVKSISKAIKSVLPKVALDVNHDLTAAARALCGHEPGIACILGTGSNSGFYNGKKITKNSPGLGYVLGDEGSGAYLGKKVLQYYLYGTFDEELKSSFDLTYNIQPSEILDKVYKQPLANRYLASYTQFLVENRGHYMVENIIEDGLNDFFFQHLCKYREIWKHPVNFVGSVAFGFKDVLNTLCDGYEFQLGTVLKKPMNGLIEYHS